jgi:subtilisin family serine protease
MSRQNPQLDPRIKEQLLRRTGSQLGAGMSEESAAEEVPVLVRLVDPTIEVPHIRVVARFGSIVTGRVPLGRVLEARTDPNVASLKVSRQYAPTLDLSVPEIRATPSVLAAQLGGAAPSGRDVVVGVCDWGVDWAHKNFVSADGCRIQYLWDQRGGPLPGSPEPYGYGRELVKHQLDAALSAADPYAALGYDPADADVDGRGSHGTHVMDIAAGNGSAPGSVPGVAGRADLVFVHLTSDDTRPEGTLGDSVRILEAVHYVIARASERPVVVNLSLGRTGGPHDDSPLVIQGLDGLLAERPGAAIAMSAGNYMLADLHSDGRIPAGGQVDLRWHVLPRNDESAEMEVWYPGPDRFRAEVVDPGGNVLTTLALGEDDVIRESGRVWVSAYHRRGDPNNGSNLVDIFIWPDAPVGTWTTRLTGEAIEDGRYHAWIERDDPGSQSRFASPTTTVTVGSICTGRNTIAVGAYSARQTGQPLVGFSSSGPTRDGRLKPDISAPGGSIRAARSSRRTWTGRTRDQTTIKSGTSMATPHVTGAVALMFEVAGQHRLPIAETRDILLSTARSSPPFTGLERARYGAGRLDVAAAVRETASRVGALGRPEPQEVHVGTPDESPHTSSFPPVEHGHARTTLVRERETYAPADWPTPGDLSVSPDAPGEDASLMGLPESVVDSHGIGLPAPTADPDGAIRAALSDAGLSIEAIDRLDRTDGFVGLRPFASRLGAAALRQLLARLRYEAAELIDPPSTHRARLDGAYPSDALPPRLLLATVGHFRDLARSVTAPEDAHALVSLGWLYMDAIRADIRTATRLDWWIPPFPPFVGAIPATWERWGPVVRDLVAGARLMVGDGPEGHHTRFHSWQAGLAGRQWRREVGLDADPAGPGRPIYESLLQIPPKRDLGDARRQVERSWERRLSLLDARLPPLSEQSTKDLVLCDNGALPAGQFEMAWLGGIEMLSSFPALAGTSATGSLRVLGAIRPIVEELFSAVAGLGWNDLVFQVGGSTCFRGMRSHDADAGARSSAARRLSSHGYGLAVDVNTFENRRGSSGAIDPGVVAIFEAFGFRWGGFRPVQDPAHFEYSEESLT